ncbi:hypothetical protein BDV19DRAFT_402143 [Aspergillus venezuelensis]
MASSQADPKSVPSYLFQCGICPQSFTRIDHLGRHVRSRTSSGCLSGPLFQFRQQADLMGQTPKRNHTDARCAINDSVEYLLSRHASLHSAQKVNTPRKRRHNAILRASQACEACAVDHLRCDNEKPCRRCQRRGIICSLPTQVEEGAPPTPAAETVPLQPTTGKLDPLIESETTVLPDNGVLLPYPFSATRGDLDPLNWETGFDLSPLDLNFLETYNAQAPFEYDEATVSTLTPMQQALEAEVQQKNNSVGNPKSPKRIRWRFVPTSQDTGYAEHGNLLLSPSEAGPDANSQRLRNVEIDLCPDDMLDLSSRDKLLSIVLGQMPRPLSLDAAAFPSPELLDRLIRYYVTAPFSDAQLFIHRHTFSVKRSRPELLLAIAAAGAVLTPDLTLQKLGFAMQEVLRHQLPAVFEGDNTLINDLELQQAFILSLEIGLWSGNGRKMELSESIRNAVIVMLRRRGRFDGAGYPRIRVHPTDTGQELEDTWRRWVQEEATKRLVYRLWQLDIQCSIVLMGPPLISYAELSLPLPASPVLWNAPNAERWRDACYLQEKECQSIVTLTECIVNMDLLERHHEHVDLKLSCPAVIQAIWGLTWEYRQMDQIYKSKPEASQLALSGSARLLMGSRYQQLTEMLESFNLAYQNVETSFLYLNITFMHLHIPMSLEELQVFAIKLEQTGDVKRHQISPTLEVWASSKAGRTAMYYAARILSGSRACPRSRMRGLEAVSLYQATLVLWAHAYVVGKAAGNHVNFNAASSLNEPAWLDADEIGNEYENENIQRFISFGRGRPMLRGEMLSSDTANNIATLNINLCDPSAVISTAIRILCDSHCERGHSPDNSCQPPLVERLVGALQKLLEVTTSSRSHH